MQTKSSLAITLSRLALFSKHDVQLEQYPTPSELASSILWEFHMAEDGFKDKKVLDLGSGTGILGIGALLLGAKEVIFVDKDPDALTVLHKNLELIRAHIQDAEVRVVEGDVASLNPIFVDVCLTNPPFGTKLRHIDRDFLLYALKCSPIVLSFHKANTVDYLKEWISKEGAKCFLLGTFPFRIKATLSFHQKPSKDIDVAVLLTRRIKRPLF